MIKPFPLFVIAGHWNPSIFTPEWVKEFLFPADESLKVDLSVEKHYAVKIETKTIQIHVNEIYLKISPLIEINPSVMIECQEIVLKMCGYLTHTPIQAFGVNFFRGCQVSDLKDYAKMFDFEDNKAFLSLGYENCISTKVTRSFKMNTKTLNVSFEVLDDKTTVNIVFNNHFVVKKINDIKANLSEDDVIQLYNNSTTLLKEIYDI